MDWFKEFLTDALGLSPGVAALALVLVGGIGWLYLFHVKLLWRVGTRDTPGLREEADKAARPHLVPGAEETYRALRQGLLTFLNNRLGAHPWSARSYDWCLRLAVAYPIITVLLVWAATGQNTSGIDGMLPATIGPESRMLTVVFLAISLGAVAWGEQTRGWRAIAFYSAAAGAAIVGVSSASSVAFAVTGYVVLTFSTAVATASTGLVAGNFTAAVAIAVAGYVAIALAVAGSAIVAATLAVATLFGAFGVAIIVSLLDHQLSGREKSGLDYVLFVSVFLLGLLVLAVILICSRSWLEMNESGRSLLVFLAALPLINSVADWLSLGLTRHLLSRAGGTWSSLGNGVVDALAAVIFLGVLAVAVTAGLQGLNALALASGAEAALIDVAGVLQRVRETPGDPAVWWVYIMLFSTLLPSFAHAVVAAAAVVTVALPGSWRDWQRKKLAAGFTEDHPQEVWRAAAFLTLRRVAAILLALLALGAVAAVLGGYHVALPWLADALLVIAETTAMALGA